MTADSNDGAAPRRERNDLLRQARLKTPSPSNSTRSMSQRELAEAVTAHIFRTSSRTVPLDRHDISRWEGGKRRRPTADYRNALRAVLGAVTDAELGFDERRPASDPTPAAQRPAATSTGSNSTAHRWGGGVAHSALRQPKHGRRAGAGQPNRVNSAGAGVVRSASATKPTNDPGPAGRVKMKIETIRFAIRDEDEAYFFRTVHQLATGCLLMGTRETALMALLEVTTKAVRDRQDSSGGLATVSTAVAGWSTASSPVTICASGCSTCRDPAAAIAVDVAA